MLVSDAHAVQFPVVISSLRSNFRLVIPTVCDPRSNTCSLYSVTTVLISEWGTREEPERIRADGTCARSTQHDRAPLHEAPLPVRLRRTDDSHAPYRTRLRKSGIGVHISDPLHRQR